MGDVQNIRKHGALSHMPSGEDTLPWMGEYPFTNTTGPAPSAQGVHMVGTFADRPDPSLGTQSGEDGAVAIGATGFSSASAGFAPAGATGSTGTLTIIDTGATGAAVTTTFTATVKGATGLRLSSTWGGSGSTGLPWTFAGPPPSNAGLHYYATDGTDSATGSLYESDGTQWIPIGGSGGNGFQFNSGTYGADNVGDYSTIETSTSIPGDPVGYSFAVYASQQGMYVENRTPGRRSSNHSSFEADQYDLGGGESTLAGQFYTESLSGGDATALFAETVNQGIGSPGVGDPQSVAVRAIAQGEFLVYGIRADARVDGAAASNGYGGNFNAFTTDVGFATGVQANAGSDPGASGDVIGIQANVTQGAGATGTLYVYRGYVGATEVFRVDSSGNIHIPVAAAVINDL